MERRDVVPDEVVPTLSGRLNSSRLLAIQSWFGDSDRRSSSPVELFKLDNEIITMDGHHRLSVAFEQKVPYPAVIYDVEDSEVTINGLKAYIETVTLKLRLVRMIAIAGGHRTYSDLLRNSFNMDRLPYLKRLIEGYQNPES